MSPQLALAAAAVGDGDVASDNDAADDDDVVGDDGAEMFDEKFGAAVGDD